jgi:hypothetical protein
MSRGTDRTDEAGGTTWPHRTGRRAFLKGAGLAGAASLAGSILQSPDAHAATASAAFSTAERASAGSAPSGFSPNLYTINYFPAVNGGYPMWSHYDGSQYQSDMQTARSLGFTSLRVFLAALPPSYDVFDWDTPTKDELARLTDFYGRSKAVGIALHLTLFSVWQYETSSGTLAYSPLGQIAGSKTWAKAILGALPDFSNLSCIEIKNEVKFASTDAYTSGFDSGWPGTPPQHPKVGQVATVWAKQMIPYIRSIAPGVPVIASTTTDPDFPKDPVADLAAFVAAVKGTNAAPTWYDYHCYVGDTPGLIYGRVQAAKDAVGSAGKLYIGETGMSVTPSGTQSPGQAQRLQADYLQTVRWSCAQLGLPDPGPWMLFDLHDSEEFTNGNTFGLLDPDGNLRPSGSLYQAVAPGSPVPAVSINGAMLGYQTDANGNVLPDRWVLFTGPDTGPGHQPIASALDSASTYRGYPSVRLYNSAGSNPDYEPPGLQASPVTAPTIKAGQAYTFSCYLKASGSYGTSKLQIFWYGASGRISGTTGNTLTTLGSSFAQYSLRSTAPSGAQYAQLFIRTPGNAGNIWVTDASWT